MDAAMNGAEHNTGVGHEALSSLTTTPLRNSGVGSSALANVNTGDDNTGVGFGGGGSITTGSKNTSIGSYSMGETGSNAITGNSNTTLGYKAGYELQGTAAYNTFIGSECADAQTTGEDNIAIGYAAMGNSTADTCDKNIFIGNYCGDGIGSGTPEGVTAIGYATASAGLTSGANGTTAIGRAALQVLTSGAGNTAVGFQAAVEITSGSRNTVMGYQAFYQSLTNSDDNVFVGYQAGGGVHATSSSSSNVGIGSGAMAAAMNASNSNVAVGRLAGSSITTGDQNTILGASSGGVAVGSNNVIVGYAINMASDQDGAMAFGRSFTAAENANLISFGNGSNTLSYDLDSGTGTISTSDERIKENIVDTPLGLNFINKLRPVQFTKKAHSEYPEEFWNLSNLPEDDLERTSTEAPTKVLDGLIAQDVKETMEELGVNFCGWSEEKETTKQYLSYNAFVAPLIKAVQELSQQVEDLKAKIN